MQQLVIVLVLIGAGASQKATPCPAVFKYEKSDVPNRWVGLVTLEADVDYEGIYVQISLDKPAQIFMNWFGHVTTRDNKNYFIEAPKLRLARNSIFYIRIAANYDPANVASLKTVHLNGRQVCKPPPPPPPQLEKTMFFTLD